MAQAVVKKMSLSPDSTWWSSRAILVSGTIYEREQDRFTIPVQRFNTSSGDGEIISFAAYEWTFGAELRTMLGVSVGDASLNVTKVELQFYYRKANESRPINEIEFASVPQPSIKTATDLFNAINTATAAEDLVVSMNDKTLVTVTIGSSESAAICTTLETSIKNGGSLSIGIRRKVVDEAPDGYVEVSGKNMLYGADTEWRAVENNEASFSPQLIVTYELAEESHIQHEMRYTTSDPTAAQSTPGNSLGGYTASNKVFTRAQIGDYLNSTQTTVTISTSSDLPSEVGIIQVGPEIIRYTGIDSSTRKLTGATRGVVTEVGFPSSLDPFGEYAHYLDVDSLFDRRPTDGISQYRCVSIINTTAFEAENIRITLIQNNDSDVQVDVGIEVPKFEAKTGTTSAAIESGSSILTSTSSVVRNKETGFFDGAHIIIDPSGTAKNAIVESYDDNGTSAEFILDRTLTAFVSGTSFRINPAPCQTISNEVERPVENSGRFFGFLGEGGSNLLGFDGIHENQGNLSQHDVFYLWVKRTLKPNVKSTSSTGALLIIRFIDNAAQT